MAARAMSLVSTVTNTLAVNPIGRVRGLEAFASGHLWTPYGARGVFGGQVVAQSLMAAIGTVQGMDLHSQHCYFLLPANSKAPITFTVERLRDGNSYATRLVTAQQGSKTVFILMASFSAPPRKFDVAAQQKAKADADEDSKDEPGITASLKFESDKEMDRNFQKTDLSNNLLRFEVPSPGGSPLPKDNRIKRAFTPTYQKPFPDGIVKWEDAECEEVTWKKFIDRADDHGIDLGRRLAAVKNYIREREQSPCSIAIARQQGHEWPTTRAIWLKPRLQPGEKLTPNQLRAFVAFMTDFQLIGTAARTVGLSGNSTPRLGMMASLDHTTHYYPLPDDFDPSAPLLHIMEAVETDVFAGRGFCRGEVYTQKGDLIATTSQEGVVRAHVEGKRATRETERNKGKL